jgi:hypothetical protein
MAVTAVKKTRFLPMVQAHRVICPVQGKQLHIELPSDFPEGTEVEVIVLPLSPSSAAAPDVATAEWLHEIWACSPDFPDRLPDLPPKPVEIP